jgi:hypothetical protein
MIKRTISKAEKQLYKDKLLKYSKASDEEKNVMISSDPSLFSYALLRNRVMGRMRLYAFQDMIINDGSKLIAVAISRQVGKTTMAIIKSLHYVLNNDNATVLVISKTLSQSKEMISKLKQLVNNSPLKDDFSRVADGYDNKSEFYVKNKGKDTYSRIISVPATDAARGYSADLVIADEIAFWDNSQEMFNEAILPTISETKGVIMMLSTPKGQLGVFWDVFTKTEIWSCYQFDWTICPHHTEENMEIYREQLGSFAFRQEYEASFEANQAAYFTREEVDQAVKEYALTEHTTLPTVIGVDFGKKKDNTIITVGLIENPFDEEDYHRVKIINVIKKPLNTDYNKVVGELKALVAKYNAVNVIYDATGVGEGPGDYIKDLGIPCEAFKFSLQSKVNIYSNLKILFEKRQIVIPKIKRLVDELCMFEYEYTTSGNMKLHHPEGGHDDYPDSLALCVYGLKRPGVIGVSFEVV